MPAKVLEVLEVLKVQLRSSNENKANEALFARVMAAKANKAMALAVSSRRMTRRPGPN